MADQRIVYPHRINLLDNKSCDVCGESQGVTLTSLKARPYMGLYSCEGTRCQKMARWWLESSTKTDKELRLEFGDWVYVRRSTGLTESGWVIEGAAYQEEEGGPFWVHVKDKRGKRQKCVTLETLRSWNSDESPHSISSISDPIHRGI